MTIQEAIEARHSVRAYKSCQKSVSDSSGDKQCNNLSMALRHADMMKEAYAQSIKCEEPCEGRLSRTVL